MLVENLHLKHDCMKGDRVRRTQVDGFENRACWKRAACNSCDRIMVLSGERRSVSPVNLDLVSFFLHL